MGGPIHDSFEEGVLGQEGIGQEVLFMDLSKNSGRRNVLGCENAPSHPLRIPQF